MQETLKYIKVLNWGYGGFAPMTLTPDYKESLEQVKERLGLLDSLNYLSLLDEATSTKGKAWLDKYSKTGGFDFSLHFMRDREQLLKSLEQDGIKFGEDLEVKKNPIGMFRWAKDGADKYKADGVWTDEKRKEYKYQLSRLEKALEDRLRQFAAAYDYPLCADEPKQQPEPQQAAPEPQQGDREAQQKPEPQQVTQEQKEELPTLNGTTEEFKIFGRAVEEELMRIEGNGYKWNLTKSLLAYMCGRLYCRDRVIEDESDYSATLSKSKRQLPANGLKKLFGVDVANNRNQLKAPPRGYNKIDKLWNLKR